MRISRKNKTRVLYRVANIIGAFRKGVFYHKKHRKIIRVRSHIFYGAMISSVKTINITEAMSNNRTIFMLVYFPASELELENCI